MNLEDIENRIKLYEKLVDNYIDINDPDYIIKHTQREYYRGKWEAYMEIRMLLKK